MILKEETLFLFFPIVKNDYIIKALPGVWRKRGIRPFILGEQGKKSQKLKGKGEQRQFRGTGNTENQDFDFGEQGKMEGDGFQGNKGTGTPREGLTISKKMKSTGCVVGCRF